MSTRFVAPLPYKEAPCFQGPPRFSHVVVAPLPRFSCGTPSAYSSQTHSPRKNLAGSQASIPFSPRSPTGPVLSSRVPPSQCSQLLFAPTSPRVARQYSTALSPSCAHLLSAPMAFPSTSASIRTRVSDMAVARESSMTELSRSYTSPALWRHSPLGSPVIPFCQSPRIPMQSSSASLSHRFTAANSPRTQPRTSAPITNSVKPPSERPTERRLSEADAAHAAFELAFSFIHAEPDDSDTNWSQYSCAFKKIDDAVAVRHLLRNRNLFKAHVRSCYEKVAVLDSQGVHNLKKRFAERVGMPMECFGPTTELDVERWDFSGTGTPTEFGVFKMLKYHLVEHCRSLIHEYDTDKIPYMLLDAAGYTILKDLGAGSQGTAKLAEDGNGKQVCLKCYPKAKMAISTVEDLMHEYVTLKSLGSDTIATVAKIFQDDSNFYMIGDCYYGGDFTTLRESATSQCVDMSRDWWRGIFQQVLYGLAFIHSHAMIHCDIKEPNLMRKTADASNPQVVIIDLGVAACMARNDSLHGTPGYVPPETLETKRWFPKGDIFSLGVVIMQLLIDKVPNDILPFAGIFQEGCQTAREVFQATRQREPSFELMPSEFPVLAVFVKKLLQKRRQDRPNAAQALADPWFSVDDELKALSPMEMFVHACEAVTPASTDFTSAIADAAFFSDFK